VAGGPRRLAAPGGGHGAVREMVELILKAQNKWKQIVTEYAN